MTTTIFLGPSLPLDEARHILPDAIFRPPAAQGDLLAAVDQDGANLIGLIDGTFHQSLSVWHNEVCFLLSRGIAVFGSSSMGALRAVETERFGMVGVGTVFRWYRDGDIVADDEVALLHGTADTGFVSLSLPLVNIRASAAKAAACGALEPEFADQLVEAARRLYYPERQVGAIIGACEALGMPPDQVRAANRALTDEYVDVKQSDARELLCAVRDVVDGVAPWPERVEFQFARSSVFEAMYNLDRPIRVGDDEVRLQAVAEHAALHCAEFDSVLAAAMNRDIVGYFGMLLGVRVTDDEIGVQEAAFRERHGLQSPDALREWLVQNAMSERDLTELMTQEAMGVRMRRWMISIRGFDRGARPILNELRQRGEFPRWAAAAAEEDVIVDAYRDRPEYESLATEHPGRLADLLAARTGVRIMGDARLWAEATGFEGAAGLEEALLRSAIYTDVKQRISSRLEALTLFQDEFVAP